MFCRNELVKVGISRVGKVWNLLNIQRIRRLFRRTLEGLFRWILWTLAIGPLLFFGWGERVWEGGGGLGFVFAFFCC